MKLTPRDRWICAILPALLTVIICQAAFTHPLARENEALTQQIRTQGPLAMRQAGLRQAESEHTQLAEALAKKRQNLIGGAAGGQLGFDRSVALQQVSKLCKDNNLALLSSSPDATVKLPAPMADMAKTLPATSESSAPRVWRLEMRGSYGDFHKFLHDLAAVPPFIIPLTLGMQPDPNEENPTSWTLTVWL